MAMAVYNMHVISGLQELSAAVPSTPSLTITLHASAGTPYIFSQNVRPAYTPVNQQ